MFASSTPLTMTPLLGIFSILVAVFILFVLLAPKSWIDAVLLWLQQMAQKILIWIGYPKK